MSGRFGVWNNADLSSSAQVVHTASKQVTLRRGKDENGCVKMLVQSVQNCCFSLTVFSRQPLSRLTFLKVVCLQTSSSDFKMIRVFTVKIK